MNNSEILNIEGTCDPSIQGTPGFVFGEVMNLQDGGEIMSVFGEMNVIKDYLYCVIKVQQIRAFL